MEIRLRFVLPLVLLAACGDGSSSSMDLASADDLAGADLGSTGDLARAGDMAQAAADMTAVDHDIRDLQDPSRPGFVQPDSPVRVVDVIVTARKDSPPAGAGAGSIVLFVQEPTGAAEYSGIMVFINTATPAFTPPNVGDLVTVQGTVKEFARPGQPGSRTNIEDVTSITVKMTGQPLPAATVVAQSELLYAPVTPGDDHTSPSEKWEGVLVKVTNPTVKSRDTFGEFTLNADLKIDDRLFAYTQPYPDDAFTSITGVLDHDFGTSRVLPRQAGDLEGLVAAPPVLTDLQPTPVQVGQGEQTPLTVTVDRPAPAGGTTIMLMTSDNTIAAPATATVVVPENMTTATFNVSGVLQSGTAVTITATLNGVPKTCTVTVVGPLVISSLTPAGTLELVPQGTGIVTVVLSRAAPVGGASVTLASGSADVLVPAAVVVPAGQTSITFGIKAGANTTGAPVTITASLPTGNQTANVEVKAAGTLVSALPPGERTSVFVINEVNVDAVNDANLGDLNCDGLHMNPPGGGQDDEFVELINVSRYSIDLAGVEVRDRARCTSGVPRHQFAAPAPTLGPGEAMVVFTRAPGVISDPAVLAMKPWCVGSAAGRIGDALAVGSTSMDLSFGNSGDDVCITIDLVGTLTELVKATYPDGADDESWTRAPDVTGPHSFYKAVTGRLTDRNATPGTRFNGAPFAAVRP
jgi:hypothetical protein